MFDLRAEASGRVVMEGRWEENLFADSISPHALGNGGWIEVRFTVFYSDKVRGRAKLIADAGVLTRLEKM